MLSGIKKLLTSHKYETTEENLIALLGLEGNCIERIDQVSGCIVIETSHNGGKDATTEFNKLAEEYAKEQTLPPAPGEDSGFA